MDMPELQNQPNHFIVQDAVEDQVLAIELTIIHAIFLGICVLVFILTRFAYQSYQFKKTEQESLGQYISSLERLAAEHQHFVHDYRNLISCINLGIYHNNMSEVHEAVSEVMTETLQIQPAASLRLTDIHSLSLRSLIAMKWQSASNCGVHFQVEIEGPTFHRPATYNRSLYRIIGILLDNAIQAAAKNADGIVSLGLMEEEGQQQVIICNNFAENLVPDLTLKRPKIHASHGWGLTFVYDYFDQHPHLGDFYTENKAGLLYQVLTLKEDS